MNKLHKFTDLNIKKIPEGFCRESSGLLLKVLKSGRITFIKKFRDGKTVRTIKLGEYPKVSIQEARVLNLQDYTSQDTDVSTVAELADEFLNRYLSKNRKNLSQPEQIIRSDIIPNLGKLNISTIKTRDIALCLHSIVDRGAPVHANKTLSLIKQMFSYAISQGICTHNPASVIKAKDVGGKESVGTRVLTLEDLKLLYNYLDSGNHKISEASVIMYKIMILTGVRSIEIREINFNEIDYNKQMWTIPASRYKTGIVHYIPLNDYLISLFKRLQEVYTTTYEDKALAHVARRLQDRLPIPKWTPHDLRRTFRTLISEQNIADAIVAEKLLGHKMPKIMATYDKDEMLPQRREALDAWCAVVNQ